MDNQRKIFIARPHGMCAGVRRALDTVEAVLKSAPAPIYVLHEIVHNNFIVNRLKERGVIFAETLAEVPEGAVLLFSAHGVSAAVEEEARRRSLRTVDATCPLVKSLQSAASKSFRPGEVLILIGHRGHPEVEGVLGRVPAGGTVHVISGAAEVPGLPELPAGTPVRALSQTTLNLEAVDEVLAALRNRWPQLESGPGVCYATTNRQKAVRQLAARCRTILIIGSPRSSNSNRLREIAEQAGARAFLIDGPQELPPLDPSQDIGVSAGASAPEELVEATVERLRRLGYGAEEPVEAAVETVAFRLPALPC